MNERIPLPPRRSGWIGADDVSVRTESPRAAQVVAKMAIDEAVLCQVGARAIEAATDEAGRRVVCERRAEIIAAVDALLLDREWLRPIVEQECRRAAFDFMASLLRGI